VTAADTEKQETTDYALAQASSEGDMRAFEELYQRHNRRVYSLCLRMTQNVSEAEDLAQEVFIQLFRKIGSFRGESAFTTWLHRLTVNQVLMHFRKRGVRMEQTTEDGETPVQVVTGTENPNGRSLCCMMWKGTSTRRLRGCWAVRWELPNPNSTRPE
jgi:RNA polymerase sigma-70 factor (ECF subfamily)